MIIDVHAHVFARPVLMKSRGSGLRFMTAEEQVRRMDEKGIDMAVILPLNGAEGPAERQSMGEVLSICERFPGRFIPFCEIDPRRHDWRTADDFQWGLEQYKEAGFKGLGELTTRLWFDHPKMMALFAACDVFACPSRLEPFGNVVIEAWAQSVPVVATDSLGPGALIAHMETGVLAPVDDGAALGRSLKLVLEDTDLRQSIARAGHGVYQARFTESVVVRHYLDFFKRIAA